MEFTALMCSLTISATEDMHSKMPQHTVAPHNYAIPKQARENYAIHFTPSPNSNPLDTIIPSIPRNV